MGAFKKGLLGAVGAYVGIGLCLAISKEADKFMTKNCEEYRDWKEKKEAETEDCFVED